MPSINVRISDPYIKQAKMKIKVRLGPKGQLVIPKPIRESVGLRENTDAILEVKENAIEIRRLDHGPDIVGRAYRRAKEHGGDIEKLGWVYGDRLCEEVF